MSYRASARRHSPNRSHIKSYSSTCSYPSFQQNHEKKTLTEKILNKCGLNFIQTLFTTFNSLAKSLRIWFGPLMAKWSMCFKISGLILAVLMWVGVVNFLKLNYGGAKPGGQHGNNDHDSSFLKKLIDRWIHYFLIDNNDSIYVLLLSIFCYACGIGIIIVLLNLAYNQLNGYLKNREINHGVSKGLSLSIANFLTPIKRVNTNQGTLRGRLATIHSSARIDKNLGRLATLDRNYIAELKKNEPIKERLKTSSVIKSKKTTQELTSQLNSNHIKILKLYSLFCDKTVKEDNLLTRVKTVRKSFRHKDKDKDREGNTTPGNNTPRNLMDKPKLGLNANRRCFQKNKNDSKFHKHILPGKFHKSREELAKSGCITGKLGVPERILKNGIFDLIYNFHSDGEWFKASDVICKKDRSSGQGRLNPRRTTKEPSKGPLKYSRLCAMKNLYNVNFPDEKRYERYTRTRIEDQQRELGVTVSETDLSAERTFYDQQHSTIGSFNSLNSNKNNNLPRKYYSASVKRPSLIRRSSTFTHSDFYFGSTGMLPSCLVEKRLSLLNNKNKHCLVNFCESDGREKSRVLRRNKSADNIID